jgi:hypothetical protein
LRGRRRLRIVRRPTAGPLPTFYEARKVNFFGAQVPGGCEAIPDGPELVDGIWITPEGTLDRNRGGNLPMVLPTLETLEASSAFAYPAEAPTELSQLEIPYLLPTGEETGEGARMVL